MHETIYDLYKRCGFSLAHDIGFSIKFTSSSFAFITRGGSNVATLKQVGPDKVTIQFLTKGRIGQLGLSETIDYLRTLKGQNEMIDEVFREACAIALEGR